VVPIFTYRDERKLLAVAGTIIVAALLALLQLDSVRSGRPNPIAIGVTTATAWLQFAATSVSNGVRDGFTTIANLPQLDRENAALRAHVSALADENQTLTEALARVPAEASIARAQLREPAGLPATVIGFDPENAQRTITIDRGARDHVQLDDGVMTGDGVVGRIVEVDPLSSRVLLVNDPTSRLPALVQRGRWWAIAVGTQTRLKLRFVSQDATLRAGDLVVTGEGRSFHAGIVIGRIRSVDPMNAGALDQSAIVDPAASLGALTRVLVVHK
jgi:rod shape-determining protein MreC